MNPRVTTLAKDMEKSLGSKLFWLPHVPLDDLELVVDYGCANAAMLKAIKPTVPDDCFLVGIENNVDMQAAACQNFVDIDAIYSTLAAAEWHIFDERRPGRKSALILSSVLHEVDGGPLAWWAHFKSLYGRHFDYIVFRDMSIPLWAAAAPTPQAWLARIFQCGWDSETFAIVEDTLFRHHGMSLMEGTPTIPAFIHGMLKAVHKMDYNHEAGENYLSAGGTDLQEAIMETHRPVLVRRTLTRFFADFCMRHGVDLSQSGAGPIRTHLECVYRRHA